VVVDEGKFIGTVTGGEGGNIAAATIAGTFTGTITKDTNTRVIQNAEFSGNMTKLNVVAGTFNWNINSGHLADGYSAQPNGDGTYSVAKKQAEVTKPSTISVTTVTNNGTTENTNASAEVKDNAEDNTVDKAVNDALEAVAGNTNVSEFSSATVAEATNMTEAYIQATPKAITVEDSGDEKTVTSITYDVKPVYEDTTNDNAVTEVTGAGKGFNTPITFRLGVPFNAEYVEVKHEGEFIGRFQVQGTDGNKYIELASNSFSEYVVSVTRNESSSADVNGGQFTLSELQKAIDTAANGNATLKLLKSVTNDGVTYTVPDGKTLTVDENGYTWGVNTTGGTVVRVNSNEDLKVVATVNGGSAATVNAGDDVTVTISVEGVKDQFYGAEVSFTIDTTKLNNTSTTLPSTDWTATTGTNSVTYTYKKDYTVAVIGGRENLGTFTFKAEKQTKNNTDVTIVASTAKVYQTTSEFNSNITLENRPVTSATLTIAKKVVSVPSISDVYYTGTNWTPGGVFTAPSDAPYTIKDSSVEQTAVNVGEHQITLTLTDTDLYIWENGTDSTADQAVTFQIVQATNSWKKTPTVGSTAYTGKAMTTEYEAAFGNNTVTVAYYNQSVATKNESTKLSATPTAVGKYTAVFTVAATANYTGLSASVDFQIGSGTISSDWYTLPTAIETLSYDGGENVALVTAGAAPTTNAQGAPEGLTLEYKLGDDGAWQTAVPTATEIGDYTVSYRIYVKDGNDVSTSYTPVTGTLNASIKAPEFHPVVTNYTGGYQMVYVFTDSENARFTYKGAAMYDISGLGYALVKGDTKGTYKEQVTKADESDTTSKTFKHVYAILTTNADRQEVKVGSTPVIAKILLRDAGVNDVNYDNKVYTEDILATQNAYNIDATYLENNTNVVFRADTNKNGTVDIADTQQVKNAVYPSGT
jgi:hypothetical protein